MTQRQNKNAIFAAFQGKQLPLNLQFFAETKSTEELLTEMAETTKEFAKTLQKQQDEIKATGTTSDQTANEVKNLGDKYINLEAELKKLNDNYTEMAKKMGRPGYEPGQDARSIGEAFIDSEQYKSRQTVGKVESQSMQVKSFYRKDLTSAEASAGVLIDPQRYDQIIAPQDRLLTIRDLLNTAPTQSNAIEYIRETGFTNSARPVAEGTLKPQSDITFDKEVATVKTIAHWVPATRQVIDDASQLRAYIDNRLRFGLKIVEENQILWGDGTGENLLGLMNTPGIQTYAPDAAANPADTKIDTLRRAMTRAVLAGYPVTGAVLNPLDWEDIELMKADNGQYIWVTVTEGGQPRIFRVPVVQTPAMTEGDFLEGAFGLASILWDREQANIRISESHADYFTRNMIAVLAEERLALTTFRPEAFVNGSFTAAPAV